jgi:hypothetical protein
VVTDIIGFGRATFCLVREFAVYDFSYSPHSLSQAKMQKSDITSLLALLCIIATTVAIPSNPVGKDVTDFFHSLPGQGLIQKRADLPTGTCNANTPCPIAACCGTNGLCGYSPSECGAGNCTSKCDSKAECGQYGTKGKQNCPLNVCCSQFGYVCPSQSLLA